MSRGRMEAEGRGAMIFESRELKSSADFVQVSELKEGTVYFHLLFCDDDLLIPWMEPVVFIGRNLEPHEVDRAYFQDLDSYREGIRYDALTNQKSPDADEDVLFQSFQEKSGTVMAVYEFESALESLMWCSLKRREKAK